MTFGMLSLPAFGATIELEAQAARVPYRLGVCEILTKQIREARRQGS
jgi:hypothetical protein